MRSGAVSEAVGIPHVRCPACGLGCFSLARWSNVDHCAACDTELPRRGIDPFAERGPSRARLTRAAAPADAPPWRRQSRPQTEPS
jgi:hypothetical protein